MKLNIFKRFFGGFRPCLHFPWLIIKQRLQPRVRNSYFVGLSDVRFIILSSQCGPFIASDSMPQVQISILPF